MDRLNSGIESVPWLIQLLNMLRYIQMGLLIYDKAYSMNPKHFERYRLWDSMRRPVLGVILKSAAVVISKIYKLRLPNNIAACIPPIRGGARYDTVETIGTTFDNEVQSGRYHAYALAISELSPMEPEHILNLASKTQQILGQLLHRRICRYIPA